MELIVLLAQATLLMLIMFCSDAQPAIEFPVAKPGCADACGNVSIPFPFGTTEECSLNLDFLVDCRNSSDINGGGYRPYLLNEGRNVSIFSISVENGQLKVFHPLVAATCNSLEIKLDRMIILPFTISSTSNLVFVTGCSNYGFFQGLQFSPEFRSTAFGCIPFCDNNFKLENTSCADGYGCCQTTVPSESISYLTSSLNSLEIQFTPPENFAGACSYSFIAEKTDFDANILIRRDSINASSEFPMVLNWSIKSSQSCGVALSRNSSYYACKEGSSCQYAGVGGYRCVCSPGYEGNPYLGGCTDIDECGRLDHGCLQHCQNIQGGYICQCGVGYLGDGRKNGTGCIPIKRSIVLVAVGSMTLGISVLLAASYLLYKIIRKRMDKSRRNRFFKKNGGQLLDKLSSSGNNIEKVHIFTTQELDKATDHFNENRVLGRGGQGTVYKGMLSDGKIIAVKKSKLVDASQVEQFINEVVILSYLDHRNVVKLLGCCLETEVPLLVYEFIPNGTLDDMIHNNEGDDYLLSWEVRLRISKEVARALAYLHSTTSIPVYHRDVKSSNILLDEKYRAKVSDFGISRHVSIEQTHLSTLVKGTFGYLDPEYFQSSQFTDKSDVYSFGVVLAELLTGRKPISSYVVEEEECRESLATKFLQSMEDNCLNVILDARVLEGAKAEELVIVAKLAQNCLNLDGRKRPTMTQVAMTLEGIFQPSHLPSLVELDFDAGKIGATSRLELSNRASVITNASSIDEFPLLSDTF